MPSELLPLVSHPGCLLHPQPPAAGGQVSGERSGGGCLGSDPRSDTSSVGTIPVLKDFIRNRYIFHAVFRAESVCGNTETFFHLSVKLFI